MRLLAARQRLPARDAFRRVQPELALNQPIHALFSPNPMSLRAKR